MCKGFEGLYEVSNYGRVRSLRDKNGRARELILKAKMNKYGYLCVLLYKNGKRKDCLVHRLVATAFIPNPDGLPCVNHKDECKQSNIVTNLEWCDAAYNNAYGTRTERMKVKKINHPSNSKRVYQYAKSGSFVRSYPSTMEAERQTGISQSNISRCCLNKPNYKSAGNYRWSFIPPTPTTDRTLF